MDREEINVVQTIKWYVQKILWLMKYFSQLELIVQSEKFPEKNIQMVYQFSIASVTDYQKLKWLKTTQMYYLMFQEVQV